MHVVFTGLHLLCFGLSDENLLFYFPAFFPGSKPKKTKFTVELEKLKAIENVQTVKLF